MNERRFARIAMLAVVLLLPAVAFGAGYIKFDGIDGEVMANGRGGYLQVESWSFGGGAPAATGPGTVRVKRYVDKASPQLKQGKRFQLVEILKSETQPGAYLKYELKNVMVSSYTVAGAAAGGSSGDRPTETVTLDYGSIKVGSVGQTPPAVNKGMANPTPVPSR